MTRNFTTLAFTALAAGGLAACSSGSSDSGGDTGTLTVGLMDTPVFDADEVWICITQVNVKPEEGEALEFALPDADDGACDGEQFDLLTLQSVENAELLIEGEDVPAGPYNWIELEVDAALDGESDADGNYDSYVMANGAQHELRVPSGSIRLVSGFTVTAGEHTRFTLDWDTRRGLTNPPGQSGYLLKPAFRILDETTFGTLNGTVAAEVITDTSCTADDSDTSVGNAVYLFAIEGLDETLEPDDTDGTEPDAVATVEVTQNEDSAYVYETIVAPGDYRIAFTCQADNDLPGRDEDEEEGVDPIEFVDPDGDNNVTIAEGETTTVDFSLPAE